MRVHIRVKGSCSSGLEPSRLEHLPPAVLTRWLLTSLDIFAPSWTIALP